MKKKYSRFRELWAVPKYQSLFKLGGYVIFFTLFFILASLGNLNNKSNTQNFTSYNTMKKNLTTENLTIKYKIDALENYYLEGTIIDDVLSVTLEINDEIKKIKIIDEKVYLIQKNEEILNDTLLKDINLIYLFPKKVMNILDDNAALKNTSKDEKVISYSIDNKSYSLYLNDYEIEKIIIFDGMITYTLEYSIIK
ncbi:MAG: hypothetical protein GX265_05340 [Mollicutes bacterium]|nr:hypothetical protein [Mollicutes bacterium]